MQTLRGGLIAPLSSESAPSKKEKQSIEQPERQKHSIVTVKYGCEGGKQRIMKLYYQVPTLQVPTDLTEDLRREDPAFEIVLSIRVVPATPEQIALFDLALLLITTTKIIQARPRPQKREVIPMTIQEIIKSQSGIPRLRRLFVEESTNQD